MQKSKWRFFPYAAIGALTVVIVVNSAMISLAVTGFPGAVDEHAFNTGNRYNEIMDAAKKQAALGWRLRAKTQDRNVTLELLDREGHALSGAAITAIAARPVGPASSTALSFQSSDAGYVSTSALPEEGRWDLSVTASIGDAKFETIQRVVTE